MTVAFLCECCESCRKCMAKMIAFFEKGEERQSTITCPNSLALVIS